MNTGNQLPAGNMNAGNQQPAGNMNAGNQQPIGNMNTGNQLPAGNMNAGNQQPVGNVNSGYQEPNENKNIRNLNNEIRQTRGSQQFDNMNDKQQTRFDDGEKKKVGRDLKSDRRTRREICENDPNCDEKFDRNPLKDSYLDDDYSRLLNIGQRSLLSESEPSAGGNYSAASKYRG